MMLPYKIRPANLEDLSALLSMVKDLSDAHERFDKKRFVAPDNEHITEVYSQWILRAASAQTLCLIAEDTSEKRLPIGYVIAEKFDADAQYLSGAHIYIHDIYCVKKARKFGLGKAMIASINHWAISSGISQIRGLVASENHASLAFFNHLGFRSCATEIAFDITNKLYKKVSRL